MADAPHPEDPTTAILVALAHLEEQLGSLSTRWEENKIAVKEALLLQAKEYDRRLSELNNESARILAAQNVSVSREFCEGKHAGIEERMLRLEKFDANLEGKASQRAVYVVTVISLCGLLLGIASFVLK